MEPAEAWPLDPLTVAMRVVRVIDQIDARDEDDEVALLSDLLQAAWGSLAAQNQ